MCADANVSVYHNHNLYYRVNLQGSVVCSHVHIEDKASLKDCLVGANFTVTREGILNAV